MTPCDQTSSSGGQTVPQQPDTGQRLSLRHLGALALAAVVLAAGAGWAFASWQVHGVEILSTLAETGLQGCL